jgi:acyl transferase domain-containing protein
MDPMQRMTLETAYRAFEKGKQACDTKGENMIQYFSSSSSSENELTLCSRIHDRCPERLKDGCLSCVHVGRLRAVDGNGSR